MPDRCRHRAHEDRGARVAPGQAWALAARPADRVLASLRAARGQMAKTCQYAQRRAAPATMVGAIRGAERATRLAAMAFRGMARAGERWRRRVASGRFLCRYVQPLLRAGKLRGRA